MEAPTLKRVNAAMAALGYDRDDYDVIDDIIVGVVEPGYEEDAILVSGNWNSRRHYGDAPTWGSEHPVRLANLLESVGAEVVWSDEWTTCSNCYRGVRTQPDSYSWQPSYIWVNDCEIVCSECVCVDVESYLEDFINNPKNAFPFDVPFRDLGFEQWEPEDPHFYETGWHPGQEAKPEDVLEEILHSFPDAEVVFSIDGTGQFDVRWSAHFRSN